MYAAMLLTICFGNQLLVCESQRTSPYPHVRLSGELFALLPTFVEADGSEIVSCSDIISAVTVTFLMYWLFDIGTLIQSAYRLIPVVLEDFTVFIYVIHGTNFVSNVVRKLLTLFQSAITI